MRWTCRLGCLIAALLAGAAVTAVIAQETSPPDAGVEGLWLTEKRKVAVELSPCGDALCGRIVWLAKPYTREGELKRDARNPDPAPRDQTMICRGWLKHARLSLSSVQLVRRFQRPP